jgi:hypothetical protein
MDPSREPCWHGTTATLCHRCSAPDGFARAAEDRRKRLAELFPAGSGVDRESLVRAYHAVHLAERYPFGVPRNVLTPAKVVQLIRA